MRAVRDVPRRSRPGRVLAGAAGLLVAVTGLAACMSPPPPPPKSSPVSSSAPSSSASTTPSPSALALDPTGTAADNKAFFDDVNRAVLARNPAAVGRDFIDALVAAGFHKADMQLTVDTTTIGLKANSIQFSVRFNGGCLIGQNGDGSGGYQSAVTPVLATGNCLVGDTRPIDW
ncbi:hypothetical protein G3T36_12025 [Diaminobutyricibacter tongyongensis]|uniref:DUF6993 domain-containing protein n=1 Tax=Leifsonia tongyongensis TaxID=1268043 RepID=A0A6L9XZ99_9MICO|nr:hypothetical protein [Diaminobutyricibacter tongyongensis]NEN06595.1 hypothetical protein [Diaminobutyricibacter tongyongensis]